MDVVRLVHQPPLLRQPTMIAAFQGWNDAGEAATTALEALAGAVDAQHFADLDPEEFFDFQVARPTVRLDGDRRRIEWPRNRLSWARLPGGNDVILLEGTEPNLRWRAFTEAVLSVVTDLGVERLITLGALQVDVPHTRPVPLSGSTSKPDLAAAHDLRPSSYEGPTGIVGVLNHAAEGVGLDAISLWAGVPHYLAATTYLNGALAIAERTVRLLGAEVTLSGLASDAASQLDDIAQLVSDDEDLAEYVADLERRANEDPNPLEDELPSPPVSGEQLAAEFERYLRDRHSDG